MRLLRWASKPSRRQQYGLTVNAWDELNIPKAKTRKRLITEEEYRHLYDNCTDGNAAGAAQEMREILELTRYTTLRPGEVRVLQWHYLQYDNPRIVFPDEVIRTRNHRVATLLEEAKDILRERHRLEAEGKTNFGYVFSLPAKAPDGVRRASHSNELVMKGVLSKRFRQLFKCVGQGLVHELALLLMTVVSIDGISRIKTPSSGKIGVENEGAT